MPTKLSDSEMRSQVAQACMDFGTHLLRVRLSSVTPEDAQKAVTDLFGWFEAKNAFTDGNYTIAMKAIDFGEELLSSRKTLTLDDATGAIQKLYSDLSE
jgi:hypothetical protein